MKHIVGLVIIGLVLPAISAAPMSDPEDMKTHEDDVSMSSPPEGPSEGDGSGDEQSPNGPDTVPPDNNKQNQELNTEPSVTADHEDFDTMSVTPADVTEPTTVTTEDIVTTTSVTPVPSAKTEDVTTADVIEITTDMTKDFTLSNVIETGNPADMSTVEPKASDDTPTPAVTSATDVPVTEEENSPDTNPIEPKASQDVTPTPAVTTATDAPVTEKENSPDTNPVEPKASQDVTPTPAVTTATEAPVTEKENSPDTNPVEPKASQDVTPTPTGPAKNPMDASPFASEPLATVTPTPAIAPVTQTTNSADLQTDLSVLKPRVTERSLASVVKEHLWTRPLQLFQHILISIIRLGIKLLPPPFNVLIEPILSLIEGFNPIYLIIRLPEVIFSGEGAIKSILKEYFRDVLLNHPFLPIPQFLINLLRQQLGAEL